MTTHAILWQIAAAANRSKLGHVLLMQDCMYDEEGVYCRVIADCRLPIAEANCREDRNNSRCEGRQAVGDMDWDDGMKSGPSKRRVRWAVVQDCLVSCMGGGRER